jgi:hypothetical protein
VKLSWEQSPTGLSAVLVTRSPIKGPVLGGVAYKKVNDVEWVRAAFRGEWTGFEPFVRLWIKEGKDATGLTVLMHNFPRDDTPSPLPDVCVRWAEWHEQLAVQGFVAANDKRMYVQDELPIQCVLRFYRSTEIGIDRLMERTSRILSGGVSLIKTDRPALDRREVAVEFCDGMLFFRFVFSPGSFSGAPLEEAVQEWIDYARSLQTQCDYPPDEGFQIAYRESLWEQMARYEQS